ncbi:uncharacterized protein C17orf53-like [Vigna radiata var. radiata]|uniref:Uncharacterized protein C17orf53-like n=1 Tax=Vigna radiata var. radiata TaxID=3916 RepID=A0A1S3TSI0_VIGRR|nr:uncharacterized protein C17orf53-like [Vigna radiata var. radiata]
MDAWEDLVYDDDVLESFLKKCDGSASLIPGPAGNVQATLLNRTISEHPKSTQEFANDVAQATFERDFNYNGWRWEEMFIQHHELVSDGKMENMNSLKEAKSSQVLPFVACIVKECKPNGLADMQLTIKDTTGTMKASLHKKVLQDPEYKDKIGIDSVMILNLVQCFGGYGRNYYLNIVHRNVVKVFAPDICSPTLDLVKATSKPTIRVPMWGENIRQVNEILRKFVPPTTEEPSLSTETNNH